MKLHKAVNCIGYSRTDMVVSPEGEMNVLEINAFPGIGPYSEFPKAAALLGIIYPELISCLMKSGKKCMTFNDLRSKKIGVLLGGKSMERSTSLRSGADVHRALLDLGFADAIKIDLDDDPIEQIVNSGIEFAFLAFAWNGL